MKDKTFSKWLIVFVGSIAIIGFCFPPAFADDTLDPNGVQIQSEDDFNVIEPLEDPELLDDNFGQNYQYTWIPWSNFVPGSSNPVYSRAGGWFYCTGGFDCVFVAGINLPSGAYLHAVQFYYYDNATANVYMLLQRQSYPTSSTTLASCTSNDTPGYSYCTVYPNHIIRNGDGTYTVYVNLYDGASNTRFHGVRLYWRRQIRTGLSHPFNDIGGLSAEFQASIAALYRSGITTGTSSTTFSPNNSVTRGQFATFFARALGLHWEYPY